MLMCMCSCSFTDGIFMPNSQPPLHAGCVEALSYATVLLDCRL